MFTHLNKYILCRPISSYFAICKLVSFCVVDNRVLIRVLILSAIIVSFAVLIRLVFLVLNNSKHVLAFICVACVFVMN